MKRTHAAITVAVVAGSALAVSLNVFAANPTQAPPDAPVVQTVGTLIDGFKWGVNHNEIVRLYNATDSGRFDQEYNLLLAKVQPGVRMQALESERESRKTAFAATFIEFKDTPTGYDAGGLKGEYTYKNHESIMSVDKDGKRRYFFFIGAPPGERFWKFYDEVPLKDGGPMGKSFPEAVTKLNVSMGVAGRTRAADPSQGIMFTTTDWQDGTTHVRAIDRTFVVEQGRGPARDGPVDRRHHPRRRQRPERSQRRRRGRGQAAEEEVRPLSYPTRRPGSAR